MKRAMLFLCAVSLCFTLSSGAEAQRKGRGDPPAITMRLYEGPELPASQVVRLVLLSETALRHELHLTGLSGDSVSPAAAAEIAESRNPETDFLKYEINQTGSVFVGLPGRYSVGVKYAGLLALGAVARDARTKKKRDVTYLIAKSKPATLQFQAAAGYSYSLSFDDFGVRKVAWVLDQPLVVIIWVKCRETGQPVTEKLRVDVFLTAVY